MTRERALTTSWHDRHRVLVVQHDDDVREAYVTMLTMAGYKVASAWSAESALRHITHGVRPCVVLFDLQRTASTKLLDALEADPWNRPTAVAVLSENAEQRILAKRRGCPILLKPVHGMTLVQTVAAHCDRHFALG